uniref:MIF4G domain-containing protein B n=1 Tax=Ceratitis capitata TaxID=7213 RepID=W8AZG8_CERCA
MAEKVEHTQAAQQMNQQNDGRKIRKSPEFQPIANITPGAILRERSFVRTSNQQNINKRRSLAFNVQTAANQHGQMRGKPAIDIYRPPNVRNDNNHSTVISNRLNINAQEFTMDNSNTTNTTPPRGDTLRAGDSRSSAVIYPATSSPQGLIPQSKSSVALHQQMQYMAATNAMANRRQAGLSLGSMPLTNNPMGNNKMQHVGTHRPILVTHSHPMAMNRFSGGVSQQIPLINSPSSGNILHQTANTNRVKFANEPHKHHGHKNGHNHLSHDYQQQQQQLNAMSQYAAANGISTDAYINVSPLQRSKSLSSADALTRGIAGLGLALGNEVTDIGQFNPDIQVLIDTALEDPNKLNSRALMELTSHFIKRAVEGRRYALPISRLCLNIIAKEQKETFLEALLNTCRQWYQEREKLLYSIQGMKSPSRLRFTAFMAFLTEMFCQLKRRQLQLRTQCEGAPPPLVLLTLLSKCCEDCVKPPVRSLSEIECLFYVLTCIGQDMEVQLPQQLELLLSLVRDAFLNASDAAPAIRRTLLQLIELQASHWQLPGNTVLYYYPSAK